MDSCANSELIRLIEATRGGDDSAFSELVSLYTPMLNKVVSGFVGPTLRHDEAFSEACVALHRAAMSYDLCRVGEVTFGLYARICVYRRVSDLSEKNMRCLPTVDVDVDAIVSYSNIEQRLVGRERMAEYMKKARGLLSEYEYQVFTLYVEGYSSLEIAEKLNRPVKSVDNAKGRLIKHLREGSDIFSDV